MKKPTKQSQILELLSNGMKPKDIAKQMKISVQTVYSARYVAKKSAPNKVFKRKAPKANHERLPLPSDAINRMTARIQLEDRIETLQIEIANLKHQIVGFRAVISYLEDLAGVRNSQ